MHHTVSGVPAQRLAQSLAGLVVAQPEANFISFLAAFWTTIARYWDSIPSLRLDKYLYLIRLYVAESFSYLAKHEWNAELMANYASLMQGQRMGSPGPLSADDGKIVDGLRYHVLDVWLDGLLQLDDWEFGITTGALKPVQHIQNNGQNKVLRLRALAVLQDVRINASSQPEEDSDSFEGFD